MRLLHACYQEEIDVLVKEVCACMHMHVCFVCVCVCFVCALCVCTCVLCICVCLRPIVVVLTTAYYDDRYTPPHLHTFVLLNVAIFLSVLSIDLSPSFLSVLARARIHAGAVCGKQNGVSALFPYSTD